MESIPHPSGLNIIVVQAVLDDINEKGIGNELPGIHELLGLTPRGVLLRKFPKTFFRETAFSVLSNLTILLLSAIFSAIVDYS